jgi:A/G-specific adenine glycosylase
MAFGKPEVAIDGNLLRIGARLFLIQDPINRMKAKSQIHTNFMSLLPAKRPGDFNQALMDLGSRICLPKNPRCGECPISDHCQAYVQDAVLRLPIKDAPKPPLQVCVQLYLVESEGAVLLRKRDFGGFLQGMWELPWYETDSEAAGTALKVAEEHNWLFSPLASCGPPEVYDLEYIFSHRHWLMTIFRYEVADLFYTPSDKDTFYLWQPLHSIGDIALPTVFKRALRMRP